MAGRAGVSAQMTASAASLREKADIISANFLRDPYLEWAKAEGVPIVEDFGVDLWRVETGPWARMGVPAAFVHLKGRGDFMSIFVIDLPPGGKAAPQKHLYEEVVYVLS